MKKIKFKIACFALLQTCLFCNNCVCIAAEKTFSPAPSVKETAVSQGSLISNRIYEDIKQYYLRYPSYRSKNYSL